MAPRILFEADWSPSQGKSKGADNVDALERDPHQREESSHHPRFARLFACLLAYSPVRLADPPAKEGSIATASRRAITTSSTSGEYGALSPSPAKRVQI